MLCQYENTEKEMNDQRWDADRLLRSLGATGRLVGFKYVVYIVEELLLAPYELHWLAKCVYRETGARFHVSYDSVDRAIRDVVKHCWAKKDHTQLDKVAGYHLDSRPSGTVFIDMLVAFLKYENH